MILALSLLSLSIIATAPATEGTVPSADGVSIHYVPEGSGAPPMVFVHGWSGGESCTSTRRPARAGRLPA